MMKAQNNPFENPTDTFSTAYEFNYNISTSKWDTSVIDIFNYSISEKHINYYDRYSYNRTMHSKKLLTTNLYFYDSKFGKTDSIIGKTNLGQLFSRQIFYHNNKGILDSTILNSDKYQMNRYIFRYADSIVTKAFYFGGNTTSWDTQNVYIYSRDAYNKITGWKCLNFFTKEFSGKADYYYDKYNRLDYIIFSDSSTKTQNWQFNSKTEFKYNLLTYTGINSEYHEIKISASPNPFNSNITIQNNSFNGPINISISNIAGITVYKNTISSKLFQQGFQLQLDGIPSGIYIVQCNDGIHQGWSKIVKK